MKPICLTCPHAAPTARLGRLIPWAIAAGLLALAGAASAQPSVVKLVRTASGGYQLLRDGRPYFIKGAGGSGSLTLLKQMGGNSNRTWGAEDIDSELAQAQRLGMTYTVGFWMRHKDDHFDYHNAAQVQQQFDQAQKDVLHLRDAPALLIWAVGNETEVGQSGDPAVWKAIDQVAAMIKRLDPNHPTMTVIAELGADGINVRMIDKYCPHIDIVGINSYGGAPTVAQRYVQAGGVKPYIITEFGPPGTWEIGRNRWGAVNELTSTQKAAVYRNDYEKAVEGQPLCLGSYAFTWGAKREATATWFGMLLPDGSRLAAADAMSRLWTGRPPEWPCPVIDDLKLTTPDEVAPGGDVRAALAVVDPRSDLLTAHWVLESDATTYTTGGATETAPPNYASAIVSGGVTGAVVHMPSTPGPYRLYVTIEDRHGGAATGNIPLYVASDASAGGPGAPKPSLPLELYGPDAPAPAPYASSGYMGDTAAISMDPDCTLDPHSGNECLKVTFNATSGWGGVVWQSPANNWGDSQGGWDLAGASKLSFWARGDQGGEDVSFGFGLIGPDKPFHDTASGKLADVKLTRDWQRYTISLTGMDLSRIVTGFDWVTASTGKPVTFYLDDIEFE